MPKERKQARREDSDFTEKLRPKLLEYVLKMDTGKAEAVRLDERVGEAFQHARRARDLTRNDVVKLIGIKGFGGSELALFENGLLSIKDIPQEVGVKLVQVLPEFLDSDALGELILKEAEDLSWDFLEDER